MYEWRMDKAISNQFVYTINGSEKPEDRTEDVTHFVRLLRFCTLLHECQSQGLVQSILPTLTYLYLYVDSLTVDDAQERQIFRSSTTPGKVKYYGIQKSVYDLSYIFD